MFLEIKTFQLIPILHWKLVQVSHSLPSLYYVLITLWVPSVQSKPVTLEQNITHYAERISCLSTSVTVRRKSDRVSQRRCRDDKLTACWLVGTWSWLAPWKNPDLFSVIRKCNVKGRRWRVVWCTGEWKVQSMHFYCHLTTAREAVNKRKKEKV